jgi:hypothetical protein
LTISASHDLALAAVRDAVNEAGVVQLDVQFRGSIDSIDAMIAERCELAGFHVDGRGGADLVAPYRQRLHAHRHAIIRFAERRQGLLLSPGIRWASARWPTSPAVRACQPSAGVGNATLVRSPVARGQVEPSRIPATTGRSSRIRRRGDDRRRPVRRRVRHQPLPPNIVSISCRWLPNSTAGAAARTCTMDVSSR